MHSDSATPSLPESESTLATPLGRWEAVLRQFRAASTQHPPPQIADLQAYLMGLAPEEQPNVLADLVREHLRDSWKAGHGQTLEAYVAALGNAFPEFAALATIPADLVEAELLARYAFPGASDYPDLDDYRRRFPGRDDVDDLLRDRCLDDGRYLRLGLRGQGGLGRVWEAYDRHLQRYVALKEPRPELAQDPTILRRLAQEARVTAGLDHPAIVTVHEYRRGDDQPPFYVMRLVQGRTLRALLQDYHREPEKQHQGPQRLLWNKLLQAFVTVCEGVAFAHARGVVHRDLKPGNVVVGPFGETVVLDWGLARRLREGGPDQAGTAATAHGSLEAETPSTGGREGTAPGTPVGTLGYMPPEQLEGTTDERSEVFGLGAILYEILTGQAPYACGEGKEPLEVVKARVREARYERPRRLVGSVPAALERICLKALARDPPQRYASAAALGQDVQHYLADEPVSAGREPWAARARRWGRRHRTAVASVAVALLVTLLLGVGGWWWLEQDRAARRQETASGVNRALGKVEQLREQVGRIRPGDPSRAAEALGLWEQALAAVEQAQGVLRAGLAEGELQRRVDDVYREVQAALKQQSKEVKLLAALDHAHGLATLIHEGQWAKRAAAEAYARAFVEYSGLDVRSASAPTLVDWLQRCPAGLLGPLLEATEAWAVSAGQEGDRRRLMEVLERVVSDPWRHRLWATVKEPGTVRLRQLAEEAQGKRLPVRALLHLGITLSGRGDKASALALLRYAQAMYPDDFWLNFALGSVLYDLKTQHPELLEEAIGFYRAALALRPGSASVHLNLGAALEARKDLTGAIAAYEKALTLDSKYARAHVNLGAALRNKKDLAGAIAAARKALELDPNYAPAHNGLGAALGDKQDLAGAIAAFRKALELDPKLVDAHYNLGNVLLKKKDLAGAIACYQKALALDPKFVPAHHNLGLALNARKDVPGAIAAFRKALELDPKCVQAYHNLGRVLADKKDLAGAIATYHKALDLDPKSAETWYNLGNALCAKKDVAGAIACYQKALQLDPNYAPVYNNLGAALYTKKDLAGAIAAFQKALQLDPNNAMAHHNLGLALGEKKDLAGAIAAYHKALALDPNYAQAHYNLGTALRDKGEFAEALAVFRAFQKLAAGQPAWKQRAAQQVRLAEQLLELDGKLPQLLQGEVQPTDVRQGLLLRQLCSWKNLHAAAARFARDAFAAQPQLADDLQAGHRYNAATSAILAGCSQGKDAPLDIKERARLRQQALQWLRADLSLWSKRLASGTAGDRLQAQQTLAHWSSDPDLTGVRDAETLAALPEGEQKAWRQLWADVAALRKQTQEKK
jgi:tetratricopeptide (TPR) repeat protein